MQSITRSSAPVFDEPFPFPFDTCTNRPSSTTTVELGFAGFSPSRTLAFVKTILPITHSFVSGINGRLEIIDSTKHLFKNRGGAMEIQQIVVVGGGGLMGSGISQVVAQAGFQVTMVEIDDAALDRGLARIDRSLERLVNRGTLTSDEAGAARGRLARQHRPRGAAAAADHVIETRRRGSRP